MPSESHKMRLVAVFAGLLAFLAPIDLGLSTASAADPTTITDLVMYGVPQESQELFRYEFGTDTYSTIGVVTDQFGRTVVDLKGLAYIPSGPDKGLYGASEESPFMDHLVKIDGLTADATLYSQDWGAGKISGMVAYQSGGNWYLLTADYGNDLYRIDPATGVGTFLCTLKNKYQGLAVDGNELVFGTTGDGAIWAIDLPARITDPSAEWPPRGEGLLDGSGPSLRRPIPERARITDMSTASAYRSETSLIGRPIRFRTSASTSAFTLAS